MTKEARIHFEGRARWTNSAGKTRFPLAEEGCQILIFHPVQYKVKVDQKPPFKDRGTETSRRKHRDEPQDFGKKFLNRTPTAQELLNGTACK